MCSLGSDWVMNRVMRGFVVFRWSADLTIPAEVTNTIEHVCTHIKTDTYTHIYTRSH